MNQVHRGCALCIRKSQGILRGDLPVGCLSSERFDLATRINIVNITVPFMRFCAMAGIVIIFQ